MIDRPHQVDEFLMNDADNLLIRTQRFENCIAGRLSRHILDEVLHDVVRDISFEQGLADLFHAVTNVAFGDLSGTPESRKCIRQTF